jgi:predicted GNAT family acetyltransferase
MRASATPEVRHDVAANRFVLDIGSARAVLEYRQLGDQKLEYYHTFVPPAFRGRGLAAKLVEQGLRYAADHDYAVVPTCSYVAAIIERRPEFKHLLR